jgi:hypothetical protein
MEPTDALMPEEEAALRALEPTLQRRRRRWALGFAAAWSLQVTLMLLDVVCGCWRARDEGDRHSGPCGTAITTPAGWVSPGHRL